MAFTWARVRPMRTNLAAKSPVNGRQEFSTKSRPGDAICYGSRAFVGCSLVFRRPTILLGMAAVAALSLCACGRNGSLELPPGPAGIQPAPAALSAPPPGPVASDASTALPTSQDTIAKTGFDAHGNPAATPGQKKPFFLDWLLQ